MDFQKVSRSFSEIVFLYICTLSELISSYDFRLFETEIVTKQTEESLEKEVVELKARLRDLEDKLKKSENRVYENLGTEQRLKSRPILEDSDNDEQQNAASEKRNEGTSKVDTEDPPPRLNHRRCIEDSSPGAPPRVTHWVRLRGYAQRYSTNFEVGYSLTGGSNNDDDVS